MFRFYNTYKVGVTDTCPDELFLANLEKMASPNLSAKSSFITLPSVNENSSKCGGTCPDTTCHWYGCFKDSALQSEYILSCVHQKSPPSYLLLTFLILGWSVAETVASTWFNYNELVTEDLALGTFSLFLFVIAFILSFFLSSDYLCNSRSVMSSSLDEPELTNRRQQLLFHSHLQVGFIVILNFLFFLKIVMRIQCDYACIPDNLDLLPVLTERLLPLTNSTNASNFTETLQTTVHSMTCISSKNYSRISSIQTILLMSICPQLLIAILYEPRIYLVLACHLTSTILLVVATTSSLYVTLPLILSAIVTSVLLYELHFQRIQSFLNHRRLQQILRTNEKNADAIHAMEMRHMIGNVAHDLKTPLASFTNGLDLINDILNAAHEKVEAHTKAGEVLTVDMFLKCFTSVHSCLTNIRNTNSFMLMTINRCIDYTKASKGMKLVPKYETVDLVEALQFPIECMSNIQERIGIKLEALSSDVCTHIITDKQWLQENLLCLLSNAVKYSAEGDVAITANLISPKSIDFPSSKSSEYEVDVDRSVNRDGKEPLFLLFEIEDNGIGLSEEAMKNLFNPFKQAQRLAGGTGLGLYSLAKRMEALKGSYGVKKRKDGKQGSLFWFALPYKPDSMAVTIKEHCKGKDNISTKLCVVYNGNPVEDKLEILIVDDAPSILKMSSMMLRRQGHEIFTAENGEIALKRIEEKWKATGKGFDIVLMDLQMPVMDGLEATKRLRNIEMEGREWMTNSSENNRNIKKQLIFGVSANSDYETTQEAFDAGFDDFMGKPFSIEMFNSTVQKHLLARVD